ncbi:MAG: CvpA family protein, partial [Clostridia bacterium]
MASNFDYSNAEGKRHFRLNSGLARVAVNLLVTLIFGAIYFYVSLPALNVQSRDLYVFAGILCAVYIVCSLITSGSRITSGSQLKSGAREYFSYVKAQCKVPAIILILIIAIAIIGGLTSWTVIRANSYKDLLKVEDSNFSQEVEEISFDKIPMLDEASAQRLGDRKLGELSDMVSQFEVAPNYTQINYKGRPVRVTPLVYGDAIKWFNNRSKGIPAYLVIDMVTQDVDVVRLESGIKYSNSEHFGRNLSRHLRFNYPTYMFMTPTFEVDDNGAPYWICPRVVRRIGLFGGTDIDGAVLVNACTGESKYYKDVPNWVDRVYSASLIIEQYDYYGTYRNGFFNSLFGQKGVTVTTSGYNYIAMNDDVYVYTGVTSAGTDQSNVGFILSNQRTKETKYYSIAGATEYSAMASAEGVVQHLNYKSTFPLLLNISSKPTYFMALKDNAQLVKMYAMVNVEQYQVVATGAT